MISHGGLFLDMAEIPLILFTLHNTNNIAYHITEVWHSMQINLWWWEVPKICMYLISRFYSNRKNLMLAKYTCFTVYYSVIVNHKFLERNYWHIVDFIRTCWCVFSAREHLSSCLHLLYCWLSEVSWTFYYWRVAKGCKYALYFSLHFIAQYIACMHVLLM